MGEIVTPPDAALAEARKICNAISDENGATSHDEEFPCYACREIILPILRERDEAQAIIDLIHDALCEARTSDNTELPLIIRQIYKDAVKRSDEADELRQQRDAAEKALREMWNDYHHTACGIDCLPECEKARAVLAAAAKREGKEGA